MSEERAFLTMQMSKALKRQATIVAAKLGISRSELVRRAIEDYLKCIRAQLRELQ